MAKHQSKPQVYKSDIHCSTLWSDIKLAVETDYKETMLNSPKCRQKSRRSNRHQQRFCLSGNILSIIRLLMLYQSYNHLTLGPTALVLGDYKSDIDS